MSRAHYLLKELGAQSLDRSQASAIPGRILVVDEEGSACGDALAATLPECHFVMVPCPKTAKRFFLSSPSDLVIVNHSPGVSCLELLSAFKSMRPSVPVVVVTGHGSEELAVQAFRYGAIDYFKIPIDVRDLELTVRAALEFRRKRWEDEVSQQPDGIRKALRFVEENLAMPLRLEQAADRAGMSVSCFERHLKRKIGMSFTVYVNGLRVTRAMELLQGTRLSMLKIALSCGFGNQSHFNRVFKKFTGVTPGQCRKNVRQATGNP